jgi:hypothetical protein
LERTLSKGVSLLLDNENGDPTRCNASGPPDHEERLASLMAGKNPRVGARVVPFDLPDTQVAILRDDLLSWLHGIDQDLRIPDRLRDPAATVREGEAFRRLLSALSAGEVDLPDEQAHQALGRAARAYDRASGYSETVVVHDAHQALLGVLNPEGGR